VLLFQADAPAKRGLTSGCTLRMMTSVSARVPLSKKKNFTLVRRRLAR